MICGCSPTVWTLSLIRTSGRGSTTLRIWLREPGPGTRPYLYLSWMSSLCVLPLLTVDRVAGVTFVASGEAWAVWFLSELCTLASEAHAGHLVTLIRDPAWPC